MIYKFTDETMPIDDNTYYAILAKEDGEYNSRGVILGCVIEEFREKGKYSEGIYLTSMRTPNSVEDLVKNL